MKPDRRAPGWLKHGVKQAYGLCLRAYPASFRQVYAAEMSEVFSDQVAEAAGQGTAPLLGLAAREAWHTAAAVLRAHAANRGRWWTGLIHFFEIGFQPEPPEAPDGRTSWPQLGLEVAGFVCVGALLLAATYLPDPAARFFASLLAAPLGFIPVLLWFALGLARGLPRWGYPALGLLLGCCAFAATQVNAFVLFAALLLGASGLWLWALRVDRARPFLPGIFHRWAHSLSAQFTRLSFGLYALLAFAIQIAFDDAYANNRTAWLAVAVLALIGGAAAYSRSRKPLPQLGALAAGVLVALLAAWLDHIHSTGLAWPGPLWIYSLAFDLLLLILAPPVFLYLWRFFRVRGAHSTQGG